jgi:RNA polymerase sigma factor (sigma-70 family)
MEPRPFAQTYACARRGDRGAQDRLARSFGEELERHARAQCGSAIRRRVEPRDLVQRALLRFVQNPAGFPEDLTEREFLALLKRSVRQEIAREAERTPREAREASTVRLEPANPSSSRGPVTRADDVRQLHTLLERMRPAYAAVLRCRVLQNLSEDETAAELGLTAEAVKKRLTRAAKELERMGARWFGVEQR